MHTIISGTATGFPAKIGQIARKPLHVAVLQIVVCFLRLFHVALYRTQRIGMYVYCLNPALLCSGLPCGTKFLQVLIFAFFVVLPRSAKKKFTQKKMRIVDGIKGTHYDKYF